MKDLWWTAIEGEPEIQAPSATARKDGTQVKYRCEQSNDRGEWIAFWGGYKLKEGSLRECLEACEEHERIPF